MANSENAAKKSVANLKSIRQELEAQGVRYVRIILVNLTNIIRVKIIPLSSFFKFFEEGTTTRGISMAMAALSLPMYRDMFLDGLPHFLHQIGEMLVIPELRTIRKLPYSTHTHAICHVTLEEKQPIENAKEIDLCPRTCLRKIVRTAVEAGITFLIGFETEVFFLSTTNPPTGINQSSYLRLSAFDSIEVVTMLEEIVLALEAQGIGVAQFHAEGGPGQFEFVTDPDTPLESVDALILTRQTIINIATKYNLKATFAPKVSPNAAGTGSHVHISVHRKGSSMSSTAGCPPGMTSDEEAFLAGLLKHLRGISAFIMSSTNSYTRIGEGFLTGVHIGWGLDNREAPLRVAFSPSASPNPERSRDYRVEVRSLDGSANPYLALAAILSAGFHGGIRNKLKLTTKELKVNPAKLSEEERRALGVTERLPSSLLEALKCLDEDSDLLVETMGATMVDVFKVLKNDEAGYMSTLSEAEQIQVHIANY